MRAIVPIVVAAAVASGAGCGGEEASSDTSDGATSSDAPPACVSSVALPGPSPPPSTHADCLADTSAFDAGWELKDDAWCVVGHYDFPATLAIGDKPTWGRHGGPLVGGPTLTRWSVPSGSTGSLSPTSEAVHATLPDGAHWMNWGVDLPFGGWTAVGNSAELLLFHDDTNASVPVVSSAPPLGLAAGDRTRLLVAGTSPSTAGAFPPYALALQAFDDCPSIRCDPMIVESRGVPGALIGAFADPDGNVFVAVQEPRGAAGKYAQLFAYDRAHVAPGACPATGPMAPINGAALPIADGQRVFFTAVDFDRGIDTLAYRLDETGTIGFGPGAPFVAPRSTPTGYFAALLLDDRGRVWAAHFVADHVTFWVFARR